MAVYRKEETALQPKAGLVIIDNILNLFSNIAVSNKSVSEEFARSNHYLYDSHINSK